MSNLSEKIDKLVDQMHAIALSTQENTQSLKEHMRRCDALEESNLLLAERIDLQRIDTEANLAKINDTLDQQQRFVDRIKTLWVYISVTASIIYALLRVGALEKLLP